MNTAMISEYHKKVIAMVGVAPTKTRTAGEGGMQVLRGIGLWALGLLAYLVGGWVAKATGPNNG